MKQSLKPHDIDDQLVIKTKHHHHLIRYTYIQHYYEYWIHTYVFFQFKVLSNIHLHMFSKPDGQWPVTASIFPLFSRHEVSTLPFVRPSASRARLAAQECEKCARLLPGITLSALLHISRLMVNFVFNSEHPSMAWELAQWSELSSARSAVC